MTFHRLTTKSTGLRLRSQLPQLNSLQQEESNMLEFKAEVHQVGFKKAQRCQIHESMACQGQAVATSVPTKLAGSSCLVPHVRRLI